MATNWASESKILERCAFQDSCKETLSKTGLPIPIFRTCQYLERAFDLVDDACTVEQYGQIAKYFGYYSSPRSMWPNCSTALQQGSIGAMQIFDELIGDSNANKRTTICNSCDTCIANMIEISNNIPNCTLNVEDEKLPNFHQ